MTASPSPIRLTELTDCGGCAAKLGADLLADALSGLGADAPAELVVGLDPADDAAAYLVAPDLAILGTVDFFPPVVDDPAAYGAIAAANAVSDVFAMGGRVLFALSVAALPEDLPREATAAILGAAAATVRAAGGTLAGGHTIRDPEPTFGLAVVGAAHPDRLLRKGGARPGDVLLLTKPLGTGLVVSGARQAAGSPARATAEAALPAAIDSMRRLNRAASEVFVAAGLAGATDITGFGLLGHAWEMARASSGAVRPYVATAGRGAAAGAPGAASGHGAAGAPGAAGRGIAGGRGTDGPAAAPTAVRFVIEAGALPALPGALDLARAGQETDGAGHNRRFVAGALVVGPDVPPELVALAHDPQTSGGLLAAVPPDLMGAVTTALDTAGQSWWRIGVVVGASAPGLLLD